MWRRSPKTLWSPLYSETSDERLRGLFCFGGPWNTLWYVSGARMKATHIVANISCNPFCPFVVRNRVRLLPCCHFCRWRAFAPVAALSNPFLLLVLHRPCGVVRNLVLQEIYGRPILPQAGHGSSRWSTMFKKHGNS